MEDDGKGKVFEKCMNYYPQYLYLIHSQSKVLTLSRIQTNNFIEINIKRNVHLVEECKGLSNIVEVSYDSFHQM